MAANEKRTTEIIVNGQKANASMKEISAATKLLNNQLRALPTNTKAFADKSKQLKEVRSRMKDINKEVYGVSNNLKKAGGMLKTFAAGFLALNIVGTISDAAKMIAEFEQANANLASILGKTSDEIKILTDDAKRLGSQTSFTASQVTELQTELAKLGFTESEIIGLTEATLQLAAATGNDLGEAAAITGATVRQFGLDASQTQRVVDVMASSFSKSALDMQKFQLAMSYVGPVAKAAGVTLEKTTALVGELANNGIAASTIGTSLRDIFSDLSKSGMTYEEAMKKINSAVDKTAVATELFGKTSATSAVILSQSTDSVLELELALNDAGGTAERMAEQQLDTLSGQMKILQSTWEGFILSLEDGDGKLAKTARGTIAFLTNAIQGMTTLGTRWEMMTTSFEDLSETAKKQLLELGDTDSGKKVADVIDEAFEGLTNGQIVDSIEESKKIFIDALVKEGEQAEESAILFKTFYEQRKSLAEQEAKAKIDAQLAEEKRLEDEAKKEEEREAAKQNKLLKKYQQQEDKRLKLEEKAAKERLKVERNIQDLRLAVMDEGLEKEIEKENLATQRKIEALVGSEQQITEQKLLLEQERELRIQELKQAQREQEAEAEAERLALSLEEQEIREEEERLALEEKFLNFFLTEEQYEQSILDLKREAFQAKLDILKAAGKEETLEYKRLQNEKAKIDQEEVENQKRFAQAKKEIKEAETEQLQAAAGTAITLIDAVQSVQKASGKESKFLAKASILLQSALEIQRIWAGASTLGPILGPILGVAQTAAAVIRTRSNIQKVNEQKFAVGGYANVNRQNLAQGGMVMGTTTRLITGEAGAEWVAPNWMLNEQPYADFVGMMEAARVSRLATGGISQPSSGSTGAASIGNQTSGANQILEQAAMQQQILNEIIEMKQLIAMWPTVLKVVNQVQETEEGIRVLNQIRDDANIS